MSCNCDTKLPHQRIFIVPTVNGGTIVFSNIHEYDKSERK